VVRRAVLVERPTEYAELLARHGTRDQARFLLEQRGRGIEEVERRHAIALEVRTRVLGQVPVDWRRATVQRAELDRFLFEPEDVVVVVGQDGLVANVAKYLDGQPVVGLNPEPDRYPGVLVPNPPAAAEGLLRDVATGRERLEARTMAKAELDDGQTLLALNELFVGHRTHQSARYTLSQGAEAERQSSSGVIFATGTGATGWAASIARERARPVDLPAPTDPWLAFFVREAWPSPATGTELTEGAFGPPASVTIACELGEGGVVFADGIEADRLELQWGQTVTITTADRQLMLVR
jgi:hypothetical protein